MTRGAWHAECLPRQGLRSSFGHSVRLTREKLGLSQEDFAERANVHRTYISSIELGKVNVGIEVPNTLAAALGLGLSELVRRAVLQLFLTHTSGRHGHRKARFPLVGPNLLGRV